MRRLVLGVVLGLLLAASGAAAQTDEELQQAADFYAQGEQAFNEGRYADAAAAFEASYAIAPYADTVYSLAVCYETMQNWEEARIRYQAIVDEPSSPSDLVQECQAALERIRVATATPEPGVVVTPVGPNNPPPPTVIGPRQPSVGPRQPVIIRYTPPGGVPGTGPVAPPVEPDPWAAPRGPGGSLMLGANVCVETDTTSCDSLDPSFGMNFDLFWRFLRWLSVDVELAYGLYDVPSVSGADTSTDVLTVLVGTRFIIPIGPMDLWFGLGLGWGRLKTSVTAFSDTVETTASGAVFGLNTGLEYRITDWVAVGAQVRYYADLYSEVCIAGGASDGACDTLDPGDTVQHFMVGVQGTFYFWSY
jgi:opacity protein-like surface antigen